MSKREISVDDFRNKLRIDREDLERCLVEHAQLFWQISEQSVLAAATRDAAKLAMEQLHAALDAEVRQDLAHREEGKITEAQVSNAIKGKSEMADAQETLQDAKIEADQWSALKEAFYQRGYMLRELVQLELRNSSASQEVANTERIAGTLRQRQGERATDRQKAAYSKDKGPVRPKLSRR